MLAYAIDRICPRRTGGNRAWDPVCQTRTNTLCSDSRRPSSSRHLSIPSSITAITMAAVTESTSAKMTLDDLKAHTNREDLYILISGKGESLGP